MKPSPCSSHPVGSTLWELAEIVLDETEKCCFEETLVQEVTNRVLSRLIRNHVRNMRIVSSGNQAEGCTEP